MGAEQYLTDPRKRKPSPFGRPASEDNHPTRRLDIIDYGDLLARMPCARDLD